MNVSIESRLIAMASMLEEARADAAKVDKGKTGAPGTRLRKVAQEVKKELDVLRKEVLSARNSAE